MRSRHLDDTAAVLDPARCATHVVSGVETCVYALLPVMFSGVWLMLRSAC
jgi:hypothetical protein